MVLRSFRSLRFVVPALLAGVPLGAQCEVLAIDGKASLVGFRTDAVGGDIVATFGAVDGMLQVDDQAEILDDVKITVKTTDVTTGSDFYDDKLRSEDFFDVDTYHDIKFESDGGMQNPLNGGMLDGVLTMRGVSLPVNVKLDKALVFEDGYRVTGRTEINRYDFGMDAYSMVVDNMVEINVDLVLRPVEQRS